MGDAARPGGSSVSLRRKLAFVAALYFIEGFPPGVAADVWPVWFRETGASLVEIGWLSTLMAAYSLKFLWSPLVDARGTYVGWITGALVVMSVMLASLAMAPGAERDGFVFAALIVFCLASATQDIAIDAYTIGFLDRGEEGPANGVRITAYRVAIVVGGGALLFLPRWVGWHGTHAVAAAMLAALTVLVRFVPRIPRTEADRGAWWPALRRWLAQPGILWVLAFVLLFRLGDQAMGPMVKPFWKDRGLTNEEIGLVSVTIGFFATVGGALLGGAYVGRHGLVRGLLVLGLFAMLSNFGYAAAAAFPDLGRFAIYGASITESFCTGLATSAFLSLLMRVCEKEHAAVQFACLSAFSMLPRFLGPVFGLGAQQLGYPAWFAGSALLAVPALALLPFLGRYTEEDRTEGRP